MADDFDDELDNILNPKKRGLGRGLGALFEDEEGDYPTVDGIENQSAGEVKNGSLRKTVGIDQLSPNPDQPRVFFNEESIDELAKSIAEHGLLQPILVRPDANNPNRFEIVAGERRWRACQKAQVHEVPIIIRDLSDYATLQIGLVENLLREDLSPIEEAKGYQRLFSEFGQSHHEIGEAMSRSRSHVANTMRLLGLPDSVQAMVNDGDLSMGHARALLRSKNPSILAQKIVSKNLTVRAAEALTKKEDEGAQATRKAKSSAKKDDVGYGKDADLLALEKSLADQLGMNVAINMKGAKAGFVTIEFLNLDQLDDVLQRLSTLPKS